MEVEVVEAMAGVVAVEVVQIVVILMGSMLLGTATPKAPTLV